MSGHGMFAIPAGQQAGLWLSYAVVLLLLPVCAVIAGVVVGVSNRDQSPEDGSLVRQFLLFLAIFAAATWGISRLPSVQSRINPEIKVREQLSANPAYEAIRKYAPSDAAKVQAALGSEVGSGVKLGDAFVRIRPLFATLVRERLGFVDQATAVMWAHLMRDVLQQMKASDPQKCVRTLYPVRGVPHPLSEPVLSDAGNTAFMKAVADVYASASAGMRNDPVRSDPHVELQALQTEYRLVMEQMKGEFGDDAVRTKDPQWREAHPDLYCDMVLRKMQLILQREAAMAGSLLREYLRGDIS
jgi:hypothetical protein